MFFDHFNFPLVIFLNFCLNWSHIISIVLKYNDEAVSAGQLNRTQTQYDRFCIFLYVLICGWYSLAVYLASLGGVGERWLPCTARC